MSSLLAAINYRTADIGWIIGLFTNSEPVVHIVLLYASVIAIGVLLGKVKIGGISLGVTFVLFTNIVTKHIGFAAPVSLLTPIQDFGLILFVFYIGLRIDPGFFESFKCDDVTFNMPTAAAVSLGIAVMFACYFIFFDISGVTNLSMMIEMLYGAVTNTPGLGAANRALTSVLTDSSVPQIASGHTCAYPPGVLGIITATIAIRFIYKINLNKEGDKLIQIEEDNTSARPHQVRLSVDNTYIEERLLHGASEFLSRGFICSRLKHDDIIQIPNDETVVHKGDEVFTVCAETDAEVIKSFGHAAELSWVEKEEEQPVIPKRVIVTSPLMNEKVLGKMCFSSVYGINITRIARRGVDLFTTHDSHLHVGDRIMTTGHEENVNRVERMMGNSIRHLDTPNIATVSIGVFIGILFGSFSTTTPGMSVPMKPGLTGGPLIVAILIGHYGYRMKLMIYTTTSANMMLREIGLVLFLVSVGIRAEDRFVDTIIQGDGPEYVYTGILITIIPILAVGTIARLESELSYFIIIGTITGTCTGSPALMYANQVCSHDTLSTSYSAACPLSMFLRIFTTQLIVLFCCG